MAGACGLQKQQVEASPIPSHHTFLSLMKGPRWRPPAPVTPASLMQKKCLSCYRELCSDFHEPPRKPEGCMRERAPRQGGRWRAGLCLVVAAILRLPRVTLESFCHKCKICDQRCHLTCLWSCSQIKTGGGLQVLWFWPRTPTTGGLNGGHRLGGPWQAIGIVCESVGEPRRILF